ncbi:MAG TPA: TonB-dependent receptor [Sphingomicrobium sp.]|nr:TonB-dependent receptor [Sphingomicrobium sp.]
MSKSSFKGSLLATTVIAGIAFAAPVSAQTYPADAPPPTTPPTNTQGQGAPATPTDEYPPAGVQSNESAAPAEPTSAREIVITGTLIRNPNLVASAPVTVVSQDEVRLRQTNTAEEVLRTIPGAAPSIGSQVNNGNNGSSYVNLRGIGSNRNIVLLDGVRIVPADLVGRVDLNNIPLALVDRVDVLTGGASSTYGADAVGGVVNFITRSDFSGMELSVSDQITKRGDGNYLRGDLTVGANFDDGRGNAVISVGYQEADPVYMGGERPYSQRVIESYDETFIAGSGSSTTVPAAFDIGGGRPRQQISPTGTGIQNFYQAYNFNPWNIFQVPFKRYNLFSAGHYDITDNLTVYARGMFSNNTVDTIIAPSGIFGSTVTVPISNPFLSAAQRQYFCDNALVNLPGGGTTRGLTPAECAAAAAATSTTDPNYRTFTVGLRRRMPELGPRVSNYVTKMFDFRAGLRGDITDKIGFDAFVSRGISDKVQNIQGYALLSRVRQSLLATNPNTCLTTTGGCVPLNIFGPEGTITPSMASFISQGATTRNDVKLSQARGTINGDAPVQLWAAQPVSFAVGAEYRKYAAEQTADLLAKDPSELGGAGGAAPDTFGAFDVYEGFGEIVAPLVSDRPFFHELQLEAGIRRSHYTIQEANIPQLLPIGATASAGFDTTTWKLAGSWAPVRDIKFRGAYNRAVRAPNISELFTPRVVGLTNLGVDPCAGSNTGNRFFIGTPATLTPLGAVCVAQGAPLAQLGNITNPTAAQANATFSGSLALKPEKADTFTIGAVLRPSMIPGLNATIDYYNIKINEAISSPTPGDIIEACFGNVTAASAASPACFGIQRNPLTGGLEGDPGVTPGLPVPLTNLGRIATDGVDVTLDYRRGIGSIMNAPARLALNFTGNWTRRNKFQAINITTPQFSEQSINRECAGYYSVNCNPNPKFSFNERTTLSIGRVDLSLLWRYIGKMRIEPLQMQDDIAAAIDAGCENPAGADPDGCVIDPKFRKISARSYFDFATRFNVNEHFDLTFTIQNLFDKQPPVLGSSVGTTTFNSGNTFPSTYDPLGRRFAAGARIKF